MTEIEVTKTEVSDVNRDSRARKRQGVNLGLPRLC